MPDGRETYLSAVVADLRGDGRLDVIFGSGGETVGGHLYRAPLAAVLDGDLSAAVELAASDGKGFIGPPALADITGDGVLDIVANAVDGRMLAFDGADHAGLWQVELPGTEAYTSLAVGYFTEDDVPDFFTSYAVGRWPDLGWSRQFMVDGRTGRIAFTDSLGLYQTASPVVLDYNGDGRDDVLLSVNFEARNALQQKRFYTMLVAVDFGIGGALQFGEPFNGSNLTSTPWVGDLDHDGLLDVLFCHTPDTLHTYVFNGFQVHRIATEIEARKPVVWGAYMGSGYDGVFRPR
jgi:hypothetical protein